MLRKAALALVCLSVLSGCARPTAQGNVSVNVNGRAISNTDVDRRVRLYQLMDPAQTVSLHSLQVRHSILQRLEDESLLLQAAARNGVRVRSAEVEAAKGQLVRSLVPHLYADRNGLRQAQQRLGINETALGAYAGTQLRIQRYLAQVLPQPKFTSAEIRAYYQQNKSLFAKPIHIRDIVVKTPTDAEQIYRVWRTTSNPAAAEGVASRLGATVVDEQAIAPASLRPATRTAVQGLRPGQMAVYGTGQSRGVVELVSRPVPAFYSLADVRGRIQEELTARRQGKMVTALVKRLRQVATVQTPTGKS